MSLQDLDTCVAAYYCDSDGVVGGNLIDQTEFGNDLVGAGTPVFATRDGFEVMDFDNAFWFEGMSPLLPGGSMVLVGVVDIDAGSGSLHVVNTAAKNAAVGNFDAVPPDNSDADWLSSTYQRKSIFFTSNSARGFDRVGTSATAGNFTAGAMNIVTAAFPTVPYEIQAALGTGTVAASAYSAAVSAPRTGAMVRIGHLKASGGITAGKYCAAKRVYFFRGNVFDHAGFAAAMAAEKVLWGV